MVGEGGGREGGPMRDVIIVGGGPAGLLLAHFLGEHGIDYQVLERGKIAQSWRMMRGGMILLSPTDTQAETKPGRFLVPATGSASEPAYPDIPGIASNPFVIHACDYVHCMAYSGKRVLILGGGTSAAQIAPELAGTG